MKRIIPITDSQRQAGRVLNSLSDSDEPVIVTQRGRASAVLISADRYTRIKEDLERTATSSARSASTATKA